MNDRTVRTTTTEQLRLKLVGKPLVGFDTRHWGAIGNDASAKGRVGGKAGKVGNKGAPARI